MPRFQNPQWRVWITQFAIKTNNAQSLKCSLRFSSRAIYTRRVNIYYDIWWLKKELSMIHGTLYFFSRNKTFFVCQDRNVTFQRLFDFSFHESSQNFSSFGQLIFSKHVTKVPILRFILKEITTYRIGTLIETLKIKFS